MILPIKNRREPRDRVASKAAALFSELFVTSGTWEARVAPVPEKPSGKPRLHVELLSMKCAMLWKKCVFGLELYGTIWGFFSWYKFRKSCRFWRRRAAGKQPVAMYNNIGLQTARGSGTNGYVQRNLSQVRMRKENVNYRTNDDLARLEQINTKKPNKEILEHERKRQIELKCLELQDMMEEQG